MNPVRTSECVNKAADVETYPIPRMDKTEAKLVGGDLFSKLDLRGAYQVELYDTTK